MLSVSELFYANAASAKHALAAYYFPNCVIAVRHRSGSFVIKSKYNTFLVFVIQYKRSVLTAPSVPESSPVRSGGFR